MILTYKFPAIPDDSFNIPVYAGKSSAQHIVADLLVTLQNATDYNDKAAEITMRYIRSRRTHPTDEEALPMLAELVEMEVGKRTVIKDPSGAWPSMDKLLQGILTLTKKQFLQMEAIVEQCNITIWYAIDYVKAGICSAHPKSLNDEFVEYIKDKKIGAQDVSEDLEGYIDWVRYADDYLENECETALVSETETVVVESYALRTEE